MHMAWELQELVVAMLGVRMSMTRIVLNLLHMMIMRDRQGKGTRKTKENKMTTKKKMKVIIKTDELYPYLTVKLSGKKNHLNDIIEMNENDLNLCIEMDKKFKKVQKLLLKYKAKADMEKTKNIIDPLGIVKLK